MLSHPNRKYKNAARVGSPGFYPTQQDAPIFGPVFLKFTKWTDQVQNPLGLLAHLLL